MMQNMAPLELGRILTFLLSFVGDIGNPLKLLQGLGTAVSICDLNSGFLVNCNRSQVFSQVEARNLGFLSSCSRVRPPLTLCVWELRVPL